MRRAITLFTVWSLQRQPPNLNIVTFTLGEYYFRFGRSFPLLCTKLNSDDSTSRSCGLNRTCDVTSLSSTNFWLPLMKIVQAKLLQFKGQKALPGSMDEFIISTLEIYFVTWHDVWNSWINWTFSKPHNVYVGIDFSWCPKNFPYGRVI